MEKLGSNVDSWPDAMTKTDRFGRKYAAWDFTLVCVVHITGYDKEMNDVSFLDYASSVLYPGKEAIWIKNQLKSACEFVEKVRKTTIFFFVKNLPFSTPYTHLIIHQTFKL